jgi:acyl-CoA synthetase (AMP-forming)/AMP-acid ligase II
VRLDYAGLASSMSQVAHGLHALGLKVGDSVGLFLSNAAACEVVLTALGCYELGAIVSPINIRYADEELLHALELLQPRFVVTTQADASRVARLAPSIGILVVGKAEERAERWPAPDPALPPLPAFPTPDREAPSCVLFTSGTTARSKGVVHSQRTQVHAGYAVGGALGLTIDDVYQGCWPVFTSSVLNMGFMSALVHGAGLVLEGAGDRETERLHLIASENATVYHGVTAPLNFLFTEYAKGGYDLNRLRRIVYGGAAMPLELIERWTALLPGIDQVHVWGMTETGPGGTYLPPSYLPRKAGAVGVPMPGCTVRIIDNAGRPLPDGEEGEIEFAGRSAALAYLRNPEASAETFVDGWVRTGDIGRIDEEGLLHFVDRKKDIINRGGLKISSAAVEDVLYRFPGVAEAAAIAVPHPALGEDVGACLVPGSGVTLDLDALAVFCAERLADYERPRKWLVVDSLPRNPMGKVLKHELRDRFATR